MSKKPKSARANIRLGALDPRIGQAIIPSPMISTAIFIQRRMRHGRPRAQSKAPALSSIWFQSRSSRKWGGVTAAMDYLSAS